MVHERTIGARKPWSNSFLFPVFSSRCRRISSALSPDMEIVSLNATRPFITRDGSEIRELLAYRNSSIRNQSLAEARVPVGGNTLEHYHARTEEIYFITAGQGRMRLEGELAEVQAGDAIAIAPGKKH